MPLVRVQKGVQTINNMKELLRTIINKKFCCHDWELVEEVSTYSKAGDKLPYKRTRVYVCKKCGKFKQLTIQ